MSSRSSLRGLPAAGIALAAAMLAAPAPAAVLGYLDPGTGSIVLQMVVGGILGAGLMLKLFWRRIKGLFTRQSTDSARNPGTDGR